MGTYKHVDAKGNVSFTNVPTRQAAPRSSYQKPSTTKTSTGIAQPKTAPIKDTPKQPVAPPLSSTTSIPKTTTTAPKTKPKTIGEKGAAALEGKSRSARLKEIMDSL